MDKERYKEITRLSGTYAVSRKKITDTYRDTIRKFELSVPCACGNSSVPGKLHCADCLAEKG